MQKEKIEYYRELLENDVRRILSTEYHREVPPELPVQYFLSFKTEGRLGALRDALHQLESGRFGHCLLCRTEMDEPYLRENLTSRLCSRCALGSEGGMESRVDILWENIESGRDLMPAYSSR